jgi:hypothetical protein
MSDPSLEEEEEELVVGGDAAYRLDLQKETTTMTMMVNAEEEVEDVGRSLLPQELYQRGGRGKENGARVGGG